MLEGGSELYAGKDLPRADSSLPLRPFHVVGRSFRRRRGTACQWPFLFPRIYPCDSRLSLTTYLGSNAILTTVYRLIEEPDWCRHPRQLLLRHVFLRARLWILLSGNTCKPERSASVP